MVESGNAFGVARSIGFNRDENEVDGLTTDEEVLLDAALDKRR